MGNEQWSCPKDATPAIELICDQVKSLVETSTKKIYQKFKAVKYRDCSDEGGTKFLFKVCIGGDNYIHIKVYQTLPCNGGWRQLSAVQEDKTKDDPLEPFNN